MIADACLPPACDPPATVHAELRGVAYTAARWTPADLQRLVASTIDAADEMAAIPSGSILAAWDATVDEFLRTDASERRSLDSALARSSKLSPEGVGAALEAVLGGLRGEATRRLAIDAPPPAPSGLLLVILASNLPALAVQPLLPALLLRRPVILKSPTAEPFFAPAFLRALRRRLPELAPCLAAITWPGGERGLEAPLLGAADKVVAYGEEEALDDIERRAAGAVLRYGPRVSLAILGPDVEAREVAPGLARDIALFDQRGCLSIHAVFTAGEPEPLAESLAGELASLARIWPPGPTDPAAAAGVQQLRSEAEIRGLSRRCLALDAGTVVVEPLTRFAPSPGLRAVRVHPIDALDRLPQILAPWDGRLQGVAAAGTGTRRIGPALEALGVSRIVGPGDLQTPDALWHNGGIHPLQALR